jgi:REP element-mobilizing transposase RayT
MQYDLEKHKRKSIRWKTYNYANNGAYFITVCTHNKKHLFGEIGDGKMILNGAGEIIDQWWKKLPEKFPGISIDEYVIMPNHFHGIIIIDSHPTLIASVGAGLSRPSLTGIVGSNENGRENRAPTLGKMIAFFKYQTTKEYNVRNTNIQKLWQRNYWDRMIRDEREMRSIREYISGNPKEWEKDEYWGVRE